MANWGSILGETLLTKMGNKPTSEVMKGKDFLLMYFSAHWCPPCRKFTPMFGEFYKKHSAAKNFETVFVSNDKSVAQFDEYYNEMPWNAVPFAAPQRRTLSAEYCGEGIPDLVVFDANGNVVRSGVVANVYEDPEAKNFPWPPPKWSDAMPSHFIKKDGSKVPADALKGKTVAVYCSAHWCPPCRAFTPQLASFYDAYKKLNPNFEIVFCSSDKTEDAMMSYFKDAHGDYLCYEYGAAEREVMKGLVDAQGIPTLAIFNEGKLVNKNGRAKVALGAEGVAAEGWEPPFVGNLAQTAEVRGVDINGAAAVIVRVEGCDDDTVEEVEKALEVVAKEHTLGVPKPKIIFFISKTLDGITQQLAALTKKEGGPRCAVPDDEPLLMIFNIPDDGAFYVSPETNITPDTLRAAVKQFQDGSLPRKQLSR